MQCAAVRIQPGAINVPPQLCWAFQRDTPGLVRRNDGAFRHGADADRQVPAMPVDDVAPAGLVERLAVSGEDVAGFIDIRVRDRLGQIFLENGLQAVEERAVVEAAAGLDVEERRVGTGRMLQPVAGLVAVRVEEEVA